MIICIRLHRVPIAERNHSLVRAQVSGTETLETEWHGRNVWDVVSMELLDILQYCEG